MKDERGFLYTMIRKVGELDPKTGDIEGFLDVLAENLAQGRREYTFLRRCKLCDVGVIKRRGHTELRYYLWCEPGRT